MRLFKTLLLALIAAAVLLVGAGAWWLQRPLDLEAADGAALPLAVQIEAGSSARGAAQALVNAGVQTPPLLLFAWFRLSGQSRDGKQIKLLVDHGFAGPADPAAEALLEATRGQGFDGLVFRVAADTDVDEGITGAAAARRLDDLRTRYGALVKATGMKVE